MSSGVNEECKRLFHEFDTNGDNKISPTELYSCIITIGGDVTLQDAEDLLNSFDSDGDGFLGYEDFSKVVEVEDKEEENVALRQAFGVYEMEGLGFITASSLKKGLGLIGEIRGVEECDRMIKMFDLDGDGVISFEEFKVMMN